jgi:hypothetical protein
MSYKELASEYNKAPPVLHYGKKTNRKKENALGAIL